MKKISLLIFSIIITLSTYAQHDDIAKRILEKVSDKTKSHSTIKADFKVEYKNLKDNSSNTSNGDIIIKGDKYTLNFMNSITYFNGTTLWSYLKDVNEVNISEPSNESEDIFSHPNKIFSIYEKGFKYKYLGERTEKNENLYIIDLYPEDLDKDYSRIRIEISKADLHIKSAKIFNKNGTRYLFSISNYIIDKNYPDSNFSFNKEKHPNVEVIDLRW